MGHDEKADMAVPMAEDGSKDRRDYAVGVTRTTVTRLQEMIRDGRLRPGDALPPQRDLAEDLKISRATLREALSILATIGQIVARPGGRGFIVNTEDAISTPSWRFAARYSPREVYQFRYIVESYAAELAAIGHTEQDVEELRESVEAFRAATRANDLAAYAQADFEFHQIMLRISRNKLLVDMHQTFASVLFESQRLATAQRGNLWNAVNEHERILEAVAMSDPEGASYYMRKHISMAGSRAGLPVTELP
ncbi:FadR/GntR family transcriptional regulator [Labrys monachus]|uniref:GntR family transcriptional repressor for pyruvate dehydrogenase complex n=1 Tax=Labrys monachus TaxID=217067 RepID=A0ABU0FPW2_9HYPH|nr:FadR/GntR family transcriptional regulator [Labrys monachus]MDQ0396496.1 GntR family transcriptional repressor for pyruvate dehydrogenase complex [Labrys monachus]